MVKSHTEKKYGKMPPELAEPLNVFTDYLINWTRKELGEFQATKRPLCVPLKNGYKIGLYNLRVFPNKMCEVWDRNDLLVHTFRDKVSAVLYTIYVIKQQFRTADEILHLDKEINKNYIDVLTMRRCMQAAIKRNDYYSADIRMARLDDSETRLKQAQYRMQVIHSSAKMRKVWE